MHRAIYISFLWVLVFSAAEAQDKKYVYKDTSLLRGEEKIEAPAEDQPVEQSGSYTTTVEAPQAEPIDTSLYANDLSLPADSIRQWKNMKEFAYARYLDSLLKEKQDKQKKKQYQPSGPNAFDRFLASSFVRVLLWVLAITFVLFVLYRLFLADGIFRRGTRTVKQSTPEVEEEVISSESDFDQLIGQSLRASDYRMAVRYQYLKTLHRLADKQFVELAKDKTNFQYVHELAKTPFQNEFATLTLNYEYVWYGEFAIDRDIYRKIETGFNNLNPKI